jgi:hypothetical protein
METSISVTAPRVGALSVDFRAARPAEIRAFDSTAGMAPAFILLTHDEWLAAVEPFLGEGPVLDPGRSGAGPSGPPGWSVWAQLASRSGDVMVGGRDRVGFPAVPVAYPDGGIGFEPMARRVAATTPLGGVDRADNCRPVLSKEGPIVCVSRGCDDCLRAATLTTWYSMIACVCRRPESRDD